MLNQLLQNGNVQLEIGTISMSEEGILTFKHSDLISEILNAEIPSTLDEFFFSKLEELSG